MRYKVAADYSEWLVKSVTLRYVGRMMGWKSYVATMLVLALFLAYSASQRKPGVFEGVMGAILILGLVVPVFIWFVVQRRALANLRKMERPRVVLTFDEEGIYAESEGSSGQLKWPAFEVVWCFPDAWLLFTAKHAYMTLPATALSEEVKGFLLEKFREHGVKVSR